MAKVRTSVAWVDYDFIDLDKAADIQAINNNNIIARNISLSDALHFVWRSIILTELFSNPLFSFVTLWPVTPNAWHASASIFDNERQNKFEKIIPTKNGSKTLYININLKY